MVTCAAAIKKNKLAKATACPEGATEPLVEVEDEKREEEDEKEDEETGDEEDEEEDEEDDKENGGDITDSSSVE